MCGWDPFHGKFSKNVAICKNCGKQSINTCTFQRNLDKIFQFEDLMITHFLWQFVYLKFISERFMHYLIQYQPVQIIKKLPQILIAQLQPSSAQLSWSGYYIVVSIVLRNKPIYTRLKPMEGG
jgi:hypothetical protein